MTKTSEQIFSPKTVFRMVALGLLAFGGAAYFLVYGDSRIDTASGNNSYSYSALGHRAFVETLRRQDIPVRISRNDSVQKAGYYSLLVIAEPNVDWVRDNTQRYLVPATRVLIVLPKRYGVRDENRRKWLKQVKTRGIRESEAVLNTVAPDSTLTRHARGNWRLNMFSAAPSIASPQVMSDAGFIPLIANQEGRLLLGKVVGRAQNVWVLSDPDILSNHGIGKGENAQLVVDMVREMMAPGGSVIVDETVHGFYHSPSLWRHVFELPFAAVTILAIAALLMLVWASAGRFGAALPSSAPSMAGKEGLIEVTARLLNGRAHGHYIVRRYQALVLRDIARLLHAPHRYGERAFDDWLDRAAAARGVKIDASELRRTIDEMDTDSRGDGAQAARIARKLFAWKQEMADGSRRHSNAPPGR